MSYANIMLYGAVQPVYRSNKDKTKKREYEYTDGNDPANIEKINAFGEELGSS